MEWGPAHEDHHSVQMLEKPTTFPSFLGRRSLVPRPLSEATDFFDIDNSSEADYTPQSTGSSRSTVSTEELATPHTGGLGGFEFHFDDRPVLGPSGPHLFRGSPDSFTLEDDKIRIPQLRSKSHVHDFTAELLIRRPLSRHSLPDLEIDEDEEDRQSRRSFTAELLVDDSPEPKGPGRPVTALNKAVAELDETKVRTWAPRQVAGWMAEAGFDASVVDKFLIHDISGIVLLDLQFEDLKELDISSFGKRHRVMSSIQHLRNSSLISMDTPIERSPSKHSPSPRAPRTLQREVRPEDCHVIAESRSRSRRRLRHRDGQEIVTPEESVSIVAIEQLLPKPHKCSKGEDCPKWRKQQRKLQRIQHEFAAEAQRALAEEHEAIEAAQRPTSENVPSLIGSSDVLGPTPSFKITAERLNEIQIRDAQESVKQFLDFQHVGDSNVHDPSPPPAASASFLAKPNLSDNLRGLPKLTIPLTPEVDISPSRTPIAELRHPTQQLAQLKAQLNADPYHYGGVASPADIYRIDTPFSAADVPVTQHSIDPFADARNVSQSVPPELRYGAPATTMTGEPILRSASTQPSLPRRRLTKQSFAPSVTPVKEDFPYSPHASSLRPSAQSNSSSDILNHAGWMRKRRTTKMLRHEWSDNYFSLDGTQLLMLESDVPTSHQLETIDVDEYAIHAYSMATSSKLSAAFKKSILGQGYNPSSQPSFAFSLIPDPDKSKRLFEKGHKSHHFAVRSGGEKVEWMRRLMLAKAVSRNGHGHHEI